MMKLCLQVPATRDGTADARLTQRGAVIAFDQAAASASILVAEKLGNADCEPKRIGGHPPLGTYRLLQAQPLEPHQRAEYGAHALVFEPLSGPALEAESFGRLGLLVYGGRTGKDGRLRRTQGGVRLSDILLDRVVAALEKDADLTLELVAIKPPAWWAFWRRDVHTHPLSDEPPGSLAAPDDELTLLNTLLASAPRKPRPVSDDSDWRDDDRRFRDRDRDSSGSSGDSLKGGGGEFGGAGASGRWDPPAAGGVDQSGRMLVAGAVAATALGVAAAAANASKDEAASLTDTSAGTSY